MTSLLIFIKHRFPWLWRMVEQVNGFLFRLRFPAFGSAVADLLQGFVYGDFEFSVISAHDVRALSAFLTGQPAARLEHFDPHGFDEATLARLLRNRAFAMMKITDSSDGSIAGYFFLRCFFTGRAFHGLIADQKHAGRGLGRTMWALSSEICARSGLRMFATVSQHNAASLCSARQGTGVTVAGHLAGGYLLIECKPGGDNR